MPLISWRLCPLVVGVQIAEAIPVKGSPPVMIGSVVPDRPTRTLSDRTMEDERC
jgi:hypothetical protein